MMNDVNAKAEKKPKAAGADKLGDLNVALMGVENDLQGRALDRARKDADWAYDVVNKAAEAGVIDLQCGDGEGEGGAETPEAPEGNGVDAPTAEPEAGTGEEEPGEGDAAS